MESLPQENHAYLIRIISRNINEVTRAVLNFFIQKFHNHKKHKTLRSKQK